MWVILGVVAAAGGVGGIVNALLSDNAFPLPSVSHGIVTLGILGNVLLGAFAASVTWGLYGPLKDAIILGPSIGGAEAPALTVTALVGAALAGAGGARVVTAEIDKRFLRSAAVTAAGNQPNAEMAGTLATATPKGALQQVTTP